MQELNTLMINKAVELLGNGTVNRVIGWKAGEFYYDNTPATFTSAEDVKALVYNGFCGANVSKYLVRESKKEGKVLVFLKPCDTYSFNQLVKETRIKRENVYVVGIECQGHLNIEKIKAQGAEGVIGIEENGNDVLVKTLYGDVKVAKGEVMLEKCLSCKSKKHVAYDELLIVNEMPEADANIRFSKVAELEKMTADERFSFWKSELSKCIRCNACRNVCPACTCTQCIFDNPDSTVAAKANDDKFEEKLFHIIRSFHVAGRCTDCGECSRVCPQNIPLHLINRKYIKDINEFYGEYQAGEDTTSKAPLTNYKLDDIEPGSNLKEGK